MCLVTAGTQNGAPDRRELDKIRSAKTTAPGAAEQPAPIAVYAATPFNAQQKQPIGTPGAEDKADFIYFQRQV